MEVKMKEEKHILWLILGKTFNHLRNKVKIIYK